MPSFVHLIPVTVMFPMAIVSWPLIPMKEHYTFFASKSSVLSPRLASSWKALLLPVSRDLEPEGEPLQQGKGQVTITSLLSCQAKSRGILVCVSATLQTISSGQGKEIARNTIKANKGLINRSSLRRKLNATVKLLI